MAKELHTRPALIPKPQSVQWRNDNFSLPGLKWITINDTSLSKLARDLQHIINPFSNEVTFITSEGETHSPVIYLSLENTGNQSGNGEAYQLNVSKNKILVTGKSLHGIYNGIQTLRQLITNDGMVIGCAIKDQPAFSWRGYMVDVARNYQSVDLLKQQIEIMSKYKLNVFHFHVTEDIAWRLAIKQYPQLTEADNMIRDKGKYYSENEVKDLIQYCKERFITFVPEIDMPGHSAAFTRAFGVNMQSEEGVKIVKNILKEFINTYDLPYFHIGADEVKITNKNFIPEIENALHDAGMQTIGWYPGGNYSDATIHQLWMSQEMDNPRIKYIDSRNLYLNHMDPMESVMSIFERQLCDTTQGDAQMLGGEICLWNDRRVANENDLLRMNPVYPSILAFAEKSWCGGGFEGAVADMGPAGSARANAFEEFENRLIAHKKKYFENLPFPYVRQSNIHWKLFGPFENDGNLQEPFWPENPSVSISDSAANINATGGTIYLRHWWYPINTSWLKKPEGNTTWYAYTKIWKEADTTGFMWIGFNNFSRSTATNTADAGTWDNRKSCIWLNGELISPPNWNHAGEKADLEIPLVDEGYEYRVPTIVYYKKGWNTFLVKLPVGSFKGMDWQNPVKWMFTAIPVHKGKGENWITDKIKN